MPRGALFCITLLAIVAGCEVAPGTRRTSATADTASGSAAAGSAAAAANTNPQPPPTPPPPANAGAGSAAAAVPPPPSAPKESCAKAATHIADLQSASLTDPNQKQTFEQQRAQVVAQVAAGCTAEGWSDAVVACIDNAQEIGALTPCSDMLRKEREAKAPAPPPGTAPTPPPTAAANPPAAAH